MAVFRNGGFRGVSEATEAKRPKSEAISLRPKRSDKFTTKSEPIWL